MLSLLLLLLVGTTFAQESGDFAQENSDHLLKAANEEDEKFDGSFDDAYEEEEEEEEESDGKDLSLSHECDNTEPDLSEKAVGAVCPNKGTCGYHVFLRPQAFFRAQRFCRCRGGNLSSIHNSHANYFVRQLMCRSGRNAGFVWIGVWRRNRCSPYRNIDGSRLDYTNWGCNRRRHRYWRRRCTAMNVRSGRWRPVRCNVRLPFICTY